MLGIWDKWEAASTDPTGQPQQLYTDGDSCAASDRQARIALVCGSVLQVKDVAEPATCSYTMNLETPALCEGSTRARCLIAAM